MADNLKQKIRPGSIELDPEDSAIIVHFDTITTDVTALGTRFRADSAWGLYR